MNAKGPPSGCDWLQIPWVSPIYRGEHRHSNQRYQARKHQKALKKIGKKTATQQATGQATPTSTNELVWLSFT